MYQNNRSVLLALVAVLTLWAMSCSPSAQPAAPEGGTIAPSGERQKVGTTQMEDAKQTGGKFLMNGGQAFGNPNDPHLVATATGRVYNLPVTNRLLTRDLYDPQSSIAPELAEKWEASPDGLTYTFHLRKGVKFQNVAPVNGREFTAEDAKYNIMRITADPSVIVEKWKARFQRAKDFGSIKSIETPDKYTLVVLLKEPYAPFMDAVANPGSAMIPREFVEKFPDKIITEGMVGTGPFIPTEYKNQQIASYKRNPDYWKKDAMGVQLPYLDEWTYLYFADSQTAVASFRARQLDAVTAVTKTQMDSVKRDDPGVKVSITPRVSINQFRFNTKFKPFQDVRVRQAISLVIDRQQFVDLVAEGIGVVSGPITPVFRDVSNTMDWLLSQPGYRKDKTADIAEAKRLMKEAGYTDGLTFGLMSTTGATGADLASLLADQLKALNITVKVEQVDYAGEWVPRSTRGEFDLNYMNHVYNFDVDSDVTPHVSTPGARNYGKFSDPTTDDLISKQQRAVNQEERKKSAQELEKRLLETAPIIYLYAPSNIFMIQPWAHNVVDGPIQGNEYENPELAWVEKH